MNKPLIKKKLMVWNTFFRVVGIFILILIIYLILMSWNLLSKITTIDKIFLVIAAVIVAFLFGRKYEKVGMMRR